MRKFPRRPLAAAVALVCVIAGIIAWFAFHRPHPIQISWRDIRPDQEKAKLRYSREEVLKHMRKRPFRRPMEKTAVVAPTVIPPWGDREAILEFIDARLDAGSPSQVGFDEETICAYLEQDWEEVHRIACKSNRFFLLAAAHAESGDDELGQEVLDKLAGRGRKEEGPFRAILDRSEIDGAVRQMDYLVLHSIKLDGTDDSSPCGLEALSFLTLFSDVLLEAVGNARTLQDLELYVLNAYSLRRTLKNLGVEGEDRDRIFSEIEEVQRFEREPGLLTCLMALYGNLSVSRHLGTLKSYLVDSLSSITTQLQGAPGPELLAGISPGDIQFAKSIIHDAFAGDPSGGSDVLKRFDKLKAAVGQKLWDRAWKQYLEKPSCDTFERCGKLLGTFRDEVALKEFLGRELQYVYGYVEEEFTNAKTREEKLRVIEKASAQLAGRRKEIERLLSEKEFTDMQHFLEELRAGAEEGGAEEKTKVN